MFRTTSAGVAAVARSLLEAAGIEYQLRGADLRDTVGGWDVPGFVINVALDPAEFIVREEDAQRARELLADLRESRGK